MSNSNVKHTPGPWTVAAYKVTPTMVERMKVGSVHHAVCTNADADEPTELLVAVCGDEPGLDSQSALDARLIAAAPEMLEILSALMDHAPEMKATLGEDVYLKIKTIWAKATGGAE